MRETNNQEDGIQKEDVSQEVVKIKGDKTGLYVLVILVTVVFVGILLWVIFFNDKVIDDNKLSDPNDNIGTPIAQKQEFVDPYDVVGADGKIIGLRIHEVIGKFFTLPVEEIGYGKTLYTKDGNECTGECLEIFEPYLASGKYDNGQGLSTIERKDGLGLQYTWDGNALYTYKEDSDGSILADGYTDDWHLARP